MIEQDYFRGFDTWVQQSWHEITRSAHGSRVRSFDYRYTIWKFCKPIEDADQSCRNQFMVLPYAYIGLCQLFYISRGIPDLWQESIWWKHHQMEWKNNDFLSPPSASKTSWTQYIRMFDEHFKFEVDLLSQQLFSRSKAEALRPNKTVSKVLCPRAFQIWAPCYLLNLCTKPFLQERGSDDFF